MDTCAQYAVQDAFLGTFVVRLQMNQTMAHIKKPVTIWVIWSYLQLPAIQMQETSNS